MKRLYKKIMTRRRKLNFNKNKLYLKINWNKVNNHLFKKYLFIIKGSLNSKRIKADT